MASLTRSRRTRRHRTHGRRLDPTEGELNIVLPKLWAMNCGRPVWVESPCH